MDHVVYVDAKAKEMEKLLDGTKTMIIRGATGRKMPYGRVNIGDILYFMNNNAEGLVKASATIKNAFNSDKMGQEQSEQLVKDNQDKLQLDDKQYSKWAGKRFLVLIEVMNVKAVEPFRIDKSNYGNMDDWLPVEKIETVKE